MLGMKHNFDIWLQHISNMDNAAADVLLRFKTEEFQQLAPDADVDLQLPSSTCSPNRGYLAVNFQSYLI